MVLEAASYNTTNVVYTTKLMRKMIDEIGSGNLKGMLDTCAVAMAGEDFREDMELLGGDMVHLHFAGLGFGLTFRIAEPCYLWYTI